MRKGLLIAGGILNTVFLVFHIMMGYGFHNARQLVPEVRSLLEAFDFVSLLFFALFVVASFFCQHDLLHTRLGGLVLGLIALVYLSRAAMEFVLFKFSPAIFFSCLITGLIYVVVMVLPDGKREPEPLKIAAEAHEQPPELAGKL